MEEWKVIIDFPAYYISTFGNVKTTHKNKNKLLIQKNRGEYKYVRLCNKGIEKSFAVHRLVAIMFIPNNDNKPFIDHINRNKYDNNINNLRWATRSENGINRERKLGELNERYISKRNNSFRVSFLFIPIYRDFKNINDAIIWRNKYLTEKNMLNRI